MYLSYRLCFFFLIFVAGKTLVLYTNHDTPFTATYSVVYAEVDPGVYAKGTVATGTVESIQDPSIGHEQHSIVVILSPRKIPYKGRNFCFRVKFQVQSKFSLLILWVSN